MAPWCHVQSAKVVRRPAPLLEVRTPIAIAIWGKMVIHHHMTAYKYIKKDPTSKADHQIDHRKKMKQK